MAVALVGVKTNITSSTRKVVHIIGSSYAFKSVYLMRTYAASESVYIYSYCLRIASFPSSSVVVSSLLLSLFLMLFPDHQSFDLCVDGTASLVLCRVSAMPELLSGPRSHWKLLQIFSRMDFSSMRSLLVIEP
jgi:hypothetical protein